MAYLRVVRARDGLPLAAHVLSPALPPAVCDAPAVSKRVLFSHATGFHGLSFRQTMLALRGGGGERGLWSVSVDHRGHGVTHAAAGGEERERGWEVFGEDLLSVCEAYDSLIGEASEQGEGVIGVGHSMGATALLIAALKDPRPFKALVLYEPIVFPPQARQPYSLNMADSPLAVIARKRKNKFASFDEAFDNFMSKKSFREFDSEVMRDYLSYGLVPCEKKNINLLENFAVLDGEVSYGVNEMTGSELCLRCEPDYEAFVYNSVSAHYIREKLPSLTDVPVTIISGIYLKNEPSSWAEGIADLIPNASFVRWEDAGHFGPFEKPQMFADTIRAIV